MADLVDGLGKLFENIFGDIGNIYKKLITLTTRQNEIVNNADNYAKLNDDRIKSLERRISALEREGNPFYITGTLLTINQENPSDQWSGNPITFNNLK